MNALLVLGFIAGSTPDADAVAVLALAKAARERAVATAPAAVGYPVHLRRWTYPGEIHAHLKTGEHRGKWPNWWVDSLTRAEAESLHDDDHEGKVRLEYVPGRTTKAKSPVNYSLPELCPTGR